MRAKRSLYNLCFSIFSQAVTFAMGIIIPKLFIVNLGSETNGLVSSVGQVLAYVGLLEAGKRLTCEGIKHRMLIIGDGVDFQKYCGMILDEQLDNIIMLGFQKNPYKYVKQLSLFICSSVWESYSMVVNEALALGIPVISTKCGGPEEVLQYGKYGVLTENNEASLYEAVKLFLCNGMQNAERYDPTHSMTSFMCSIDDLFLGED